MPKIYSVDQAVHDNRPMVELRGELYYLTDLTLEERLRRMTDLFRAQERAEEQAAEDGVEQDDEEWYEYIRHVVARAAREALEDVPDEVAESLTQMEFEALKSAIQAARETVSSIDPVSREATEEELGKVKGRRAG